MAATISVAYSKPQAIHLGNPWENDLILTELMNSVMSNQYPLLPPLGGEMDTTHPSYAPAYTAPQTHPSHSHSHLGPFSSPNPGIPSLAGQQQGVGDKRRNKLGYHRTTMACGHCRKRKIRCVPTLVDLHGRCENCIRLKKECCFYPVDQPPPSESQHMQLAHISPAPTGAVHPYPPAVSGGNSSGGEVPVNNPFSPMTQQPPHASTPTLKSDIGGLFPLDTTNKAALPPSSTSDQPFDFAGPPGASWVPENAAGSKPADLNPTWRGYPESPGSAQFSPYGPTTPSGTWTPGSSEAGSREDMPWTTYPPPGRSMSYGGEPVPGHPSQYPPVPQRMQFDRRASTLSDVYTPTMEASVPAGMEPPGPLSARTAPLPSFGTWTEGQQTASTSAYTYPAWGGHEEDGTGQAGFAEHGQQLAGNRSPHGAYFATR